MSLRRWAHAAANIAKDEALVKAVFDYVERLAVAFLLVAAADLTIDKYGGWNQSFVADALAVSLTAVALLLLVLNMAHFVFATERTMVRAPIWIIIAVSCAMVLSAVGVGLGGGK